MIEWINPKDRLPEENCPVLIRVGKDIHVAYLRRAKQEVHSSAYAWLPFDNSMGWFPFDVSSWAEIPETELKSGWFYKDSGKEYKGVIYTGKDMFADKDGNEIIFIPPSKR